MNIVERVFGFKDILEDKKVKHVALRLTKYASLWWTNIYAKRAKKIKSKIKTWAKMKSKLKNRLLPPSYLQDNCSQLHSLTQGDMSVKEYTRGLKSS